MPRLVLVDIIKRSVDVTVGRVGKHGVPKTLKTCTAAKFVELFPQFEPKFPDSISVPAQVITKLFGHPDVDCSSAELMWRYIDRYCTDIRKARTVAQLKTRLPVNHLAAVIRSNVEERV